MVDRAAAVPAEHARGVGVVHHDRRPELLGRGDDLRQRRDVAVHAEDAVRDDEDQAVRRPARVGAALLAGLAQQLAQGRGVLVREDDARRLAHPHAVDDRGVVERVGDDQVVLAGHDRDDAGVGGEARLEGQHRLGVLELGQLGLEPLVDRHVAGDRPDRAGAGPEVARRRDRRFLELGVRGEAQVVVRGEVDQLLAVDHDLGRLGRAQHAHRPVEVLAA